MWAYHFELFNSITKQRRFVTPVRGTYNRVVNDVSKCEIEFLLRDIDDEACYTGVGFLAMHYRGRIEDIWAIMDYERTRFGSVRVYGENLAYLLRDILREAPSDTSDSLQSGDIGTLMRNALTAPLSQSFWLDYITWKPSNVRVGFQITVKHSWGSLASLATAISDSSHVNMTGRYHIVWYVRGHGFGGLGMSYGGDPVASIYIVIPRHVALRPSEAFAPSVNFEWSNAYTVVIGYGKGLGSDRDVFRTVNPLGSATTRYREEQAGTYADDAESARRAGLRRGAGSIGGEIVLRPNWRYYDWFELGDYLAVPTVSVGKQYLTRQVAGQVRSIRGEFGNGVIQHKVELVK